MKLFYKQGACSLASHIMLYEVSADFEIEAVNTDTKITQTGQNYLVINPNGYVPALEIDDGIFLSEGVAILQYIADNNSSHAYSPALGSYERAQIQQFLNYAAAELHKAWEPLFHASSADASQAALKAVQSKFDYLEGVFSDGRDYLVANTFSVADAYTFVLVYWTKFKAIDLTDWPYLEAFLKRIAARPSTQAAFAAEGLKQ